MGYPEASPCPSCRTEVDETRSSETNYMVNIAAGQPGGPTDWYPCAGCLSILSVEWIAVHSLGDDGWGISPTGVLLPGTTVARVIERIRATIAEGDARRPWHELFAHASAKWLVKTPEVVAAVVAGLRGSALASRDLEARVCSRSDYASTTRTLGAWFVTRHVHSAELDDVTSTDGIALRKMHPSAMSCSRSRAHCTRARCCARRRSCACTARSDPTRWSRRRRRSGRATTRSA